jgi:hypothetical protein
MKLDDPRYGSLRKKRNVSGPRENVASISVALHDVNMWNFIIAICEPVLSFLSLIHSIIHHRYENL